MDFAALLRSPALSGFVSDQDLKDILTRQEIRITDSYLQREVMAPLVDEELQALRLEFREGGGSISGSVRKRPLPFALPFSIDFTLNGFRFTPREKKVYLKVEEVKPVDLEWVTARVVNRIPFLNYAERDVAFDLQGVPKIAQALELRLAGVRVFDYLTVRDLSLRSGEMLIRVGVEL